MRRDANSNPNPAPARLAAPIQVHPGIPLRHTCPRCNGTGCTSPPELPINGRRLGCALCGDSGRVDDEAMHRVRAGRAIRNARRESKLTPRQFAAQCGVSVVDLLLMEQGLRPATPRVMDRACPVMRSADGMECRRV